MKRLNMFLFSALLILGLATSARAESSASVFSGKKYYEQQVFVEAYNSGSGSITQYSPVIIDVNETAGNSLGSFVKTTSTAVDKYTFGVASETILSGGVGKICVRGPHIIRTTGTITAGTLLGTSTTDGVAAVYNGAQHNTLGGSLGITLKVDSDNANRWWIWVNPQVVAQ